VATAAEDIADTTLEAVERGAKGLPLDPSARMSFRAHFIPRILIALENPDWRWAWGRERRYVLAYAEAMGLRAAIWAGRDGRRCITAGDIDEATTRLRGYMPVAGRWCPQ
jgi:hypothetical protein